MQAEHIELAVDRHERPISFSRLLWSSDGSPWPGFRLERHAVGPVGLLEDFAVPEVLLGLCMRGSAELEIGSQLHKQHAVVRPGVFTLLAAGGEQAPIRWAGTRETLYLSMQAEDIDRLMGPQVRSPAHPRAIRLRPQYAITDPHVSRLMLNMVDEAAAGCPGGKLYGEALCISLASYLMSRFGAADRRTAKPGGTLSRAMSERVVDFMHANIDRNISLAELGELVGLSPHHFSLVFKNTFGTTPHQFLLLQRVEKAKRLLASGGQSIGEAALEVGFSNQSHFTRMFRRLIGETPREYRQARS
jgi:AraC family transcriptional regulator